MLSIKNLWSCGVTVPQSACVGMRKKALALSCAALLVGICMVAACARTSRKTKVRVLIVPKFEIGEITGGFPGEAQLFYEAYCAGCEAISIPHTTPTAQFYMNEENGVGLLLTGSGKTATGLSLVSLLSWDAYDFSDTTIVSVGCGGGSVGLCTLGDVVLVTAACDNELGHRTDSTELKDPKDGHTWFYDKSFADYSCQKLNPELCERAYELIKDCPLRTTEASKRVLAKNYPGEEWALRDPRVIRGSAVSGDTYWKGIRYHEDACYIAERHGCPDQYAVTEMEEVALMNAAECFGMKERVISLRVIVNMDVFLEGESPESLWLDEGTYASKVKADNSETVDIFQPGMENLCDVGRIVIDAVLAEEL